MRPPRLVAALFALVTFTVTSAASAWTEARPTALATEVDVDHDGAATVSMRIRWTVLGGRMHEFDLPELPPALPLLEATAVTGNGAMIPVTTRIAAPGRMVVALGDERQGVRRGTVDVSIRYSTSLRAQGLIRRSGSEAIVELHSVPWSRGLEGVDLRVTLPRATHQAQWIRDDTPGVDTESSTELTRDVVHGRRRHLPANERWTVRLAVDPSIFPWLTAGTAQRPSSARIASRPWGQALLLAGISLVAMFFLIRVLSRTTAVEPARLPATACVLGALGVVLQPLHVLNVSHALPGGVLLALFGLTKILPTPQPRAVALRTPSRTLSEATRNILLQTSSPGVRRAALVLALAAVATGIAGASLGHAWVVVVASELTLALITWCAWSSRVVSPSDLAALVTVEKALDALTKRTRCARLSWRVQGDPSLRASVRLRLVPRRGWRLARGVRSLACEAIAVPSALGEKVLPLLSVRVAMGSPCEHGLRLLAARAGNVTSRPEEEETEYRCVLIGADRDVALSGLRAMMNQLFRRLAPMECSHEASTREGTQSGAHTSE